MNESGEILRLALDSAGIGIWEWDVRTHALVWDDRMLEFFGLDRADQGLDLTAWAGRLHPEDRAQVLEIQREALRGQGRLDQQYRIVRPDGTVRHLKVDAVVMRDEAWRPLKVIGAARDITDQITQAQAFQRLNRLYVAMSRMNQAVAWSPDRASLLARTCEVMVEAGGLAMAWIGWNDPGTNQVAVVAQYGDHTGYLEQISIRSDDTPEGHGPLGLSLRTNMPQVLNDLSAFPDYRPWRDAAARSGFGAAAAFPLRARGQAVGALSVHASAKGFFGEEEIALLEEAADNLSLALDLLDLKDRQKQDEETIRRISIAMEQSQASIVITDAQGGIQYVNPSFTRLTGYTAAEAQGQHPNILKSGAQEPAFYEAMWETLTAGRIWSGEIRNRRKDGGEFTENATMSPVLDEQGLISGYIAIKEDITARKWAEAQLRDLNERLEQQVRARTAELEDANRELEAFSYSVSHDLRSPLQVISACSGVLLEDAGTRLSDKGRLQLERILGSALNMGRLIDDLLKLSRVGRGSLEVTELDLSELARTILDSLAQRDPARVVRALVPGRLKVAGDPSLLAIALENLLGNAWKYTSKTPEAELELGVLPSEGEPVLFVRDNGAGFDMGQADRLFAPFQRLHASSAFEGTGLGLATVQRIIHRHGGRIWAEAAPGRGATFFFTLT